MVFYNGILLCNVSLLYSRLIFHSIVQQTKSIYMVGCVHQIIYLFKIINLYNSLILTVYVCYKFTFFIPSKVLWGIKYEKIFYFTLDISWKISFKKKKCCPHVQSSTFFYMSRGDEEGVIKKSTICCVCVCVCNMVW